MFMVGGADAQRLAAESMPKVDLTMGERSNSTNKRGSGSVGLMGNVLPEYLSLGRPSVGGRESLNFQKG